jgi:hypothetical protein
MCSDEESTMRQLGSDDSVFLMMPFGRTPEARRHCDKVHAEIRSFMELIRLRLCRADQRRLNQALWKNISEQMEHSWAGVAVLDATASNSVSANVFVEIGYMLCLDKPVLVLCEESTQRPPSDLSFLQYETYSQDSMEYDIPCALAKWLAEQEVITPGIADLIAGADGLGGGPLDPLPRPGSHIAVVNFGHPHLAFRRYVLFLSQVVRQGNKAPFVQILLRPCHPRLLVDYVIHAKARSPRSKTGGQRRLWMSNPKAQNLPRDFDPYEFAKKWFCKIKEQLPPGAHCVVICENTSLYMGKIRNKQAFVQFELELAQLLEDYCDSRFVSMICTYDWRDMRKMIGGPNSRNVERLRTILRAHDEVIAIKRNGSCLRGDAGSSHADATLSRYARRSGNL